MNGLLVHRIGWRLLEFRKKNVFSLTNARTFFLELFVAIAEHHRGDFTVYIQSLR